MRGSVRFPALWRWNLPARPQSYPLSASNFEISGGGFTKDPFPLRQLWIRPGYMPVMKLDRLGVQIGLWQ